MNNDQRARITAEINALATADGEPVAIRHVCAACAALLDVGGVSLCVIGDLGTGEPVHATDDTSEHVVELEITRGCGPGIDALEQDRPVLAANLATRNALGRWPLLVPALLGINTLALFAFPLTACGVTVGVLELYRHRAGDLTVAEERNARLFAESAMNLLVESEYGETRAGPDVLSAPLAARWDQVNRAVAVVSAQLDSDLAEAYARMRAHAFVTGQRLPEIAELVLAGGLRFEVDGV